MKFELIENQTKFQIHLQAGALSGPLLQHPLSSFTQDYSMSGKVKVWKCQLVGS